MVYNPTKETLQTALECVEAQRDYYVGKMGPTEKERYKRVIAELQVALLEVNK